MAAKDLIPFNKRSEAEQRELSKKGGIASGIARRKKKARKEILKAVLRLPDKDYNIEAIANIAEEKGGNIDAQDLLVIAQLRKALKGNTTAAVFIRDLAGEKPSKNVVYVEDPYADLTTEELRAMLQS